MGRWGGGGFSRIVDDVMDGDHVYNNKRMLPMGKKK